MATYRQIQDMTKARFGFMPKTCWIADIKARHGLTQRVAPNRMDLSSRQHPCPPQREHQLTIIMRDLGVLP